MLWWGSVHGPWLLCGEVRLDQVRWDPQNNLKGSYNHILKVSACQHLIWLGKGCANNKPLTGERRAEQSRGERRRIIIHTLPTSHLARQGLCNIYNYLTWINLSIYLSKRIMKVLIIFWPQVYKKHLLNFFFPDFLFWVCRHMLVRRCMKSTFWFISSPTPNFG